MEVQVGGSGVGRTPGHDAVAIVADGLGLIGVLQPGNFEHLVIEQPPPRFFSVAYATPLISTHAAINAVLFSRFMFPTLSKKAKFPPSE